MHSRAGYTCDTIRMPLTSTAELMYTAELMAHAGTYLAWHIQVGTYLAWCTHAGTDLAWHPHAGTDLAWHTHAGTDLACHVQDVLVPATFARHLCMLWCCGSVDS